MDGIAHFVTPDAEVFCLSDGVGSFGADVFPGLSDIDRAARLAEAGDREIRTEFNAVLIRQGRRLTLVDTGYGTLAGAKGGHVPARLAALGVAPTDIDTLFFTHLHGDHVGGALVDGAPAYPNARVVMHGDEAAYWQGRDAAGGRFLAAMGNAVQTLSDGDTLLPGVTLWHLAGHTPGHSGLRMAGLVVVGDIFHSAALQLPQPETFTIYDVEPLTATTTRKAALALIAENDLVFTCGHAVDPFKFARLIADGAGYRVIPA
jgi:glyoxylase-like metal-dependent hydrolase (beta-lactamase superfamily II)